MPTTTTTRPPAVGLRVLVATLTRTPPPVFGSRCSGALTHHETPPPATATVIVVLEPSDGRLGTLTCPLDVCDACAAALPAA